MCDSLARFGGYDELNVMMCPQVFSPGPEAGEMLPLNERSACIPSAIAASDGKIYPDPCDDPGLTKQERFNVVDMYHYQCPKGRGYEWYWDCPRNKKSGRGKPREPDKPIISVKNKRHTSFPTTNGFPSADHPLQKRFAGMLVKSRDASQSAVRVCESMGSIGPDFFSEHERMFCDMTGRKLYPACVNDADNKCFDSYYNETRRRDFEKREEPTAYVIVKDWV
jgi:hypothetical protein